MFVRKKKNRSGSYSVMLVMGERIPGKANPVLKMVKNFGVASDEKHLQSLLNMAETYRKNLLASSPKAKYLKISLDDDLQSCHSYNVGFSDVYGSAFSKLFSSIDMKAHLLQKLKELVILRIAEPCSKRRTANIATDYGFSIGSVDTIYKLMDKLTDSFIVQTKQAIYANTVQLLSEKKQAVDVLFYDLTTLSFETNSSDELRDFGFSKDGKHQHVQIMLAVIVTKEGLPVDYQTFPGNTFEGNTLLPVIEKMKTCYSISKIVIVADAALMNKLNLETLTEKGIHYVIAARIKKATKPIKEQIFNLENYRTLGQHSEETIKAQTITMDTGDKLFVYHSAKRARKDQYDREKLLEKIRKHVSSTAKSHLTSCLKKTYVKVNKDCKIELDEEKLAFETQYDGFFGIRSNIKEANAEEILAAYHGLWQIEQTFRITKTNLAIRPVFHYSPERIQAHILICYMALSLMRTIEFKLKSNNNPIPHEQLYLLLSRMRKIIIMDSQQSQFELLEDPPKELIPIYHILNIDWHKKFRHIL